MPGETSADHSSRGRRGAGAARGARVTGIDASAGMLRVAGAKA